MSADRARIVNAAVASWRVVPFQRGTADCCAFADYVVQKITGQSFIPWTYDDDEGAETIITEHGNLSGAVTYAMERAPVPVEQLEPGDVVYVTLLDHSAVGVLMPTRKVAVMFENGVVRLVPLRFADHGWKVWV